MARERLPATPSSARRTDTDSIPKETLQRFPQLFWSGSRYIFCCPNNNCIRTIYKSFACSLYYYGLPNAHLGAEILLPHCLSYTAASVQSPSRCSGCDLCLPGQLAEAVYIKHLSHRECLDSNQFANQKDKSSVLQLEAADKHLPVGLSGL